MKIKVIDLNLWNGGKLSEKIKEFIEKESPDVVCYQETWNSTNENGIEKYGNNLDFGTNLGFKYTFFSPAFSADNEKNENFISGNMICSKFTIVKEETIFYESEFAEVDITKWVDGGNYRILPRNLQHARIDANGVTINIFNTQGIWDTHGEDTSQRIKMGETIAKETENKENVILTGDFNTKPHTKTIGIIEKNLRNVFKNELKTTFNMKQKTNPGYADAVVDMVFVSPNIKVLEHTCPQVDISDHLPLVCVFEV